MAEVTLERSAETAEPRAQRGTGGFTWMGSNQRVNKGASAKSWQGGCHRGELLDLEKRRPGVKRHAQGHAVAGRASALLGMGVEKPAWLGT